MNICRCLSGFIGKIDEEGLMAFEDRKITLRVSVDGLRMSLSLADESGHDPTMLFVPLEPVADELRRVLEKGGNHGS